ncbi:MAG: hypothetical protein ACXABK_02565 [Candidatus Heimdallarchaeaceae archaeon]|jgi:hypothetical protein
MTTTLNNIELKTVPSEKSVSESPLFLINGKLERLDWRKKQHHFFRFLEILPRVLRKDVPSNLFNQTVLHFQTLNELLLESHFNDETFNNGDMLAYFLALLENHSSLHKIELQEKTLLRILRFWGIDSNYDYYFGKIALARTFLEKSDLLKFDQSKCLEEIQSKVIQLFGYLESKLHTIDISLDRVKEKVYDLLEKQIIPFANSQDTALIMIVAFFPEYLAVPALNLYFMLNIREDFKVDLAALKRRVTCFRKRLRKINLI